MFRVLSNRLALLQYAMYASCYDLWLNVGEVEVLELLCTSTMELVPVNPKHNVSNIKTALLLT